MVTSNMFLDFLICKARSYCIEALHRFIACFNLANWRPLYAFLEKCKLQLLFTLYSPLPATGIRADRFQQEAQEQQFQAVQLCLHFEILQHSAGGKSLQGKQGFEILETIQ